MAARPFNVSHGQAVIPPGAKPPNRPDPALFPRERQIEQLLRGEIIPEDEVRVICEKTKEVLSKEENVVPVRAPVTVVRPLEREPKSRSLHFPLATATPRGHLPSTGGGGAKRKSLGE